MLILASIIVLLSGKWATSAQALNLQSCDVLHLGRGRVHLKVEAWMSYTIRSERAKLCNFFNYAISKLYMHILDVLLFLNICIDHGNIYVYTVFSEQYLHKKDYSLPKL
jgi:hypothetical protein